MSRRGIVGLLMAAGALGLVAMYFGLVRVGWDLPLPAEGMELSHGAVILCGFLGTLIALERVAALGRRAALIVPAMSFAGGVLALLAGAGVVSPLPARALFAAAGLGLAAILLILDRRAPSLPGAILTLAALLWAAGSSLWLFGVPLFKVVPWWAGFLVLTIAAERVEMSRLKRRPRGADLAFVVLATSLIAALGLLVSDYFGGLRLLGGVLVALALWLLAFDIARTTVRRTGTSRFAALCVLAAHAWLAAAGALAASGTIGTDAFRRDAFYHALFLGFTFSMVLAHAPVILPALTGARIGWSRWFYVPAVALHGTVALRVAADLQTELFLRQLAGLGNVAALLLIPVALFAARQSDAPRPAPAPPPASRPLPAAR